MAATVHYAGELSWIDKKGASSHVYAGWAACCSGDRARAVRRAGNHTYDPKLVTCKGCLQRLEWARGNTTTPLERAEAYIKALEAYIERQNTCVACECCLHPRDTPPYCEDSCLPDEDQEIAWEKDYLEDPVKQLRERFGR